MLTPPGGRTEIEKITDIDAPLVIQGSEVYAGSYQGALGGMALESGNLIWLIEASIYSGIATDDDDIYVSQADGSVMALSRFTGREIWKKENLLNRYPSAPALLENSLIIGDLEGYIHWLDKKTGETQQRISVGSSKITSTPLILDRTIYVLTDDGDLISILTLSNSS
jgi:outer membrane protein assembly factor BamB